MPPFPEETLRLDALACFPAGEAKETHEERIEEERKMTNDQSPMTKK
jgi:hypothetical protein